MSSVATTKEDNSTNDKNNQVYGKVQNVGNSTNIAWHNSTITRADIENKNKHKSAILWFTGLSGSGKSTLANAVHQELFHNHNVTSYVLDGDNIRHGLCRDLGFTDDDRVENIRRIGEVASLFLDSGTVVLTAFVSPFRSDRDRARSLVKNKEDFIEIYCEADLAVCEGRDTKGLYAKARAGIIPNFTGISSKYEHPENPELSVATGSKSLEDCVNEVIHYLQENNYIAKKD
mmetsp:Transcript_3812/g.4669  ORF Transcript_3812/g.4669 Transcript_3812/m.4669 type:complete len:232 (-) Transcript_3812:182-877(-)|eukprot:CAMPEP_0203640124 /NCGR_PEP_ID=MMETSP0088-20131115/5687_1 /ASSEMBLY_ACC=CAM_ASM_001087 /TAXON_ID=426623 /ORGANISM="Chaetoceros affinis, Strain CCMP159" /LENGTH=231 /DNA_ID=CAMNT_0050495201 /DNA_START=91 /DNA_END=786 /DNA_ORIENTATION=-